MPGKAPSGSAESISSIATGKDSGSAADIPTRPSRGSTTAIRNQLAEAVEGLLPAFLHPAEVRRGLRRRVDDIDPKSECRFSIALREGDGVEILEHHLACPVERVNGQHNALVRHNFMENALAGIHGAVGAV